MSSELPGGFLHFTTKFRSRKGLDDSHLTEKRIRQGAPAPADGGQNPAFTLAIILGCYLMIILDISVVITALPSIHQDLGLSTTGLSWVQNAYTLTFGGLLLLGARAGDILGRRQVFVAGIALFTFASMLGGIAQSPAWLLGARALQGVGAAIAAPSTLALLTISFAEGPERTRAVAWYSAVAGAGGSIGLLLGGALTSWVSWRCGLFINVPLGVALIWLAPRYLPETRAPPRPLRPAGRAELDARHDRARLRPGPRRRTGLGRRLDARLVHRGRGAAGLLRRQRAAGRAADHAAAPLLEPRAGRRLRRPDHGRRGDVLDLLLPHPVPAGSAGLRRPRGRLRLPAADPLGLRDGAGRAADRAARR